MLFWPAGNPDPGYSHPPIPTWSGERIEVGETIILREPGVHHDYGWAQLKWVGEGDCSQREGMPPMFKVEAEGVTISRLFIVGAPDGIHIKAPNVTLDRVICLDVCEDAVTAKDSGCDGIRIINCRFENAEDKVLQLTRGRDHVVQGCLFINCVRPVRLMPGTSVTVSDCVFQSCKEAIRISGPDTFADIRLNRYIDCHVSISVLEGATYKVDGRWMIDY